MGFFSSKSNAEYKVGDKVRVKYRGQEGYVIDINDSLIWYHLMIGDI